MTHDYVETNGMRLHVAQAGPEDGPLLILLHGFPEFWRGWRRQLPAFAAAGYRVWAPDQRGYNLSDRPQGVDAYNLDLLAADVVGLIDAAGAEKAYLVGHDWGGAVAWWVAMRYPQRLHKLGMLNSPHPYAMARALRGWAQRLKSWYMLLFQIPWLPEQLIRFNNWQAGVQSLVKSSRRGTFDEADLAAYRQAWAQPGAMTAMLNWYRAMAQHPPQGSRKTRVTVPTLVLWGVRDTFLGPELAEMSVEMCDNGRFHLIEGATHWVQHEAADEVNRRLLDFFAANA
ncbi:MAG: alpha/beta hydrolase [Anaerolineales bacterium]|nr:alpha/beta hydrolase [Anaerolineales bacterium]